MLTKMKLAFALCTTLVGGVAAADEFAGKGTFMQKYDTNHDGKLDDQERAAMRADLKAKREAREHEMLAKYDTNHDGKLDDAERKVMIDDQAAAQFKQMDLNGDGVISLAEFKQFRESRPMRHARWNKHHRGGGARNAGTTKP